MNNQVTPAIIGTPLTPSALRVMLLGSGELGKEVIIALQRLGVETIAVDRYANAPGHQVAHRAHVINMADGSALRALIEKEKPHIIVPEIEAIATDMLEQIEREGLARVIPTARAARLTMNREGIRRLAAETLGLPTSTYQFADSLTEMRAAIDRIGYPCIIKPVMSSSGKGQSKVETAAEIEAAWHYAASGSRVNQGRVIVEGMIRFDYEITQLTVRAIGADGNTETHFCAPIGHVQVDGDYVESWQPQAMSPLALQRTREIAKTVTDDLGGLGIFGVELFVKGDQVWFSEVSPRPHDTGMVTMCTQIQNEFELHARAILGLPVDVSLREPGASAVIYGQLEQKGIAFKGVEQALRVPQSDIRLFGKPESFKKRRMGVALANGKNTDEARARAKLAAGKVIPVSAQIPGRHELGTSVREPGIMISGILHATFLTTDLAKARVFYEQVLGLQPDPNRPTMSFHGVWYSVAANQQIHLMSLPDPEAGLQRPAHGGRDRHVALAVSDIAQLIGRLDQAGVVYTRSQSGRRALFCRDPDGNALEFIEAA